VTTFWDLVQHAAEARPDAVLFADDHGRTLTAPELLASAEQLAAALAERGVGPGDVVSWQLPSVLEAPVTMAACARLGAVQNPIIPVFREREVGFITRQLGTRLAIVPHTWRGFEHAAMLRDLGVEVLALDLEPLPADGLAIPAGDPATLADPPVDPHECRWVYYSSGTTADPKGVRHSDATVIAAGNGVMSQRQHRDDDVSAVAWPFAHIGGVSVLTSALRTGGKLVMFDAWGPAVTPERMAAHGTTILGSATPFFQAYVAAQRRHGDAPLFTRLRSCISGGAPVAPAVIDEVSEVLGVPGILNSWGLTEFPVATTETPADPGLGTTAGRPVEGVQVRVVDGELRLKGPQCFLGYADPTLDADAFDDEGWMRSGDLGEIDGDGRVRVTGRVKEIIIRNAENISALEVEGVLTRHPAVADAAVVGIPDPHTGERVAAVVVLQPGTELTLADLVEHGRGHGLAAYKTPERLLVLDVLPRNPMGKVLKRDLQRLLTDTPEGAA